MKMNRFARIVCAAALSLALVDALAQAPKINAEAEMKQAVAAANAVVKLGPFDIPLSNQATLKLPQGYQFIPQPQADMLLKAMGNGVDPTKLGIIIPPNGNSIVVPRYIASGYIKDDEARNWKADDMLDGLKKGTEQGNTERVARGFPELEVVGWTQKPAYDQQTHRLTWGVEMQDKVKSGREHGVNFNTYLLGREGYLSIDLVGSLAQLAANKPFVETLLVQTNFNAGKTYADFKSSTDKVAEYGIAALVTGLVAKKLGMFALIAAFALKFAKLIAVAVIGLFAGVRKYFKRSQAQ